MRKYRLNFNVLASCYDDSEEDQQEFEEIFNTFLRHLRSTSVYKVRDHSIIKQFIDMEVNIECTLPAYMSLIQMCIQHRVMWNARS